ncbi:hypothetical protein [Brucella thiophenivorans]|uniref:hypothetical protein n=1 Tax=Brucella thiophenivorans TaxID=571255 RepID=UPI000B998374|nr:hypothetical protein [Brucella thiophenivorans]
MDIGGAFGTIFLAGTGALIANFTAKWIESWSRSSQSVEAQRDADLQDMIKSIQLLGEYTEKFWLNSAKDLGSEDIVLRAHMVAQQHEVTQIISDLFKGPEVSECNDEFLKLASAATGGSFGDPDREVEAGRLSEVLIASRSLERKAKKARRNLKRKFMA